MQDSSSLMKDIPEGNEEDVDEKDMKDFDPFENTRGTRSKSSKSRFILQESNIPNENPTTTNENPIISSEIPSTQATKITQSTPINTIRSDLNNSDGENFDSDNGYDEDADDLQTGYFPNKKEELKEIVKRKKEIRDLERAAQKTTGSSSKKARVEFPHQLPLTLGEAQATAAASKIVRMVEMISKDLERQRSYNWMPQQR